MQNTPPPTFYPVATDTQIHSHVSLTVKVHKLECKNASQLRSNPDKSNAVVRKPIAKSINWYEGAILNEKNYLPGSKNEPFQRTKHSHCPVMQCKKKRSGGEIFQVQCGSRAWLHRYWDTKSALSALQCKVNGAGGRFSTADVGPGPGSSYADAGIRSRPSLVPPGDS